MKRNSERGSALLLVMIAVALGAMVIPAFLGHADTSLIGSRHYGEAIHEQYAADSGVEDAIWRLTDGGLADILTAAGSMVNYSLDEAINGLTTNITISNAWETIATENFTTTLWNGGTGWTDNWTHSGDSLITSSGGPTVDTLYHLRLRATGVAKRSVNLSRQSGIHLRFWAKTNSFESPDTITCQVSSDNVNWTVVHTWMNYEDDNHYRFYDIDLSPYQMTSRFWISFNGNMSSTNDQFYVDKIDVVWLIADPIIFAWDNFEGGSGNWSGGGGWTANWTHSAYDADIIDWDNPPQGSYHLLLQNTSEVKRPTDLTNADTPRLKFWARARSIDRGENATCQVSSNNGTTWQLVKAWYQADNQLNYKYYDFPLSPYTFTSNFWIRFKINANSSANDYFYVDDIKIVNLDKFGITARAGGRILRAIVQIEDGVVKIISWYYV